MLATSSAIRTRIKYDAKITGSLERYELERIAAPTLVISMADDLYGTVDVARYTAENIPRARLIVYPTGGHVGVGRQREIMLAVAAFLKETDAR